MQPENRLGPRVVKRAFFDHEGRASLLAFWGAFLRRLENELDRASDLAAHPAQQLRNSKTDGQVRIMAARVMNARVPRLVRRVYRRCYRQCIHVGAPCDYRAWLASL